MMEPVFHVLSSSTEWVDTIAMLGFSLAGILSARGRGVDPVGVFVLAFTSAFGGVTVRDLLLDIRPFYWVSHEAFTWLILFFTIFAPGIAARLSDRIARELFLWADAVGLGFFSASATVLAWEQSIPPLSCTLVGATTGIVGGILRDVLLNRLPAALSDRKPYGLAAFIGCWLGVILLSDGVAHQTVIFMTGASIVLIRIFTLKVNWEIRYRSVLARRIFPGNGPETLTRILRKARRPKAARFQPPASVRTEKSSESAHPLSRTFLPSRAANLPSAAPWKPIDAPDAPEAPEAPGDVPAGTPGPADSSPAESSECSKHPESPKGASRKPDEAPRS